MSTNAATGITESRGGPDSAIPGLRVGWLNALIIGATILVWLTLIGSVIAGIAIANDLDSSDDPSLIFPTDDGTNTDCPAGMVLNSNGYCVAG